MKIKINSLSGDKDLFVEGELLQIIEDLRQGKINIENIITSKSWLYFEKTNKIINPTCFIVDYDVNDCDVEVTIYDYFFD